MTYSINKHAPAEASPTCCCGCFQTHVEKGAFVIAFIGAALCVVYAIAAFIPSTSTHIQNVSLGVFYLFSAILYLSIIVAQQKRNPLLYLPFLILEGIGLIGHVLLVLFFIVLTIVAPTWLSGMSKQTEMPVDVESVARLGLILTTVVVAIIAALNAWFYSIIFRAYTFMKNEPPGALPPV